MATAGSDGKETVHQTIGTTRFNLSIGNGIELGTRTYFVNYLPGSTSVLLGFNEMRSLNLDLQVSQLRAPQGAKLLHTRETESGKLVTTAVPLQQKPNKCKLKSSVDATWKEEVEII
eukprot:SAG31_NODE_1251_length_9110_cov_5.844412_9_plen_116_part_01